MYRVYSSKLTTLSLSLFISLKFNYKHHSKNIISMVSMISIIGITLGVAVLIIGLSTMNGFEYELNHRILAIVPHGEIESIDQPWKDWIQTFQSIMKLQSCVTAAPYINCTGLIKNKENLSFIKIKGVDPRQEEKLSILPQFIQGNSWINFKPNQKQIIIGKGIADTLKVKQGDWIPIIIYNNIDYKLKQFKQVYLQITGVLQLNSQIDHNFAIIPIDDARTYLNIKDNSITGIAIKVSDALNINNLVINYRKIIGSHVYIKSWLDTYDYIYRDIRIVRIIIYLAMTLVISLSCFNIISILTIIIKNKSSDVLILRILGAENNLIHAIFVWYGLLIGIIGSICGALIGIVVSLQLTVMIHYIEQLIGHKFLSSSVYFIDFLPSKLEWLDVFHVLMFTIFLSLITSWYSAIRAIQINPIQILNKH